MLEGFLLGAIFAMSLTAGLFFLRFWEKTRDILFLAFACAFFIEGLNRLSFLFLETPGEGSPAIYSVRLLAFLLIIAAIVSKSRRKSS